MVSIERKGPSATVEDVVRAAHSAKPKLYRHFDDRDDLFDSVAQAMVAAIRRRLSGAVDMDMPPRKSAQRAASGIVALVQRFPQSTRFLFEHQMVGVRGKPAPALRPTEPSPNLPGRSRHSWSGSMCTHPVPISWLPR